MRLKTSTVLYIIGTSPYYLIREPDRTIPSIRLRIHCILLSPLLDLLTRIHVSYSLFNLSSFHSSYRNPVETCYFWHLPFIFDFVTARYFEFVTTGRQIKHCIVRTDNNHTLLSIDSGNKDSWLADGEAAPLRGGVVYSVESAAFLPPPTKAATQGSFCRRLWCGPRW